MPITANIAAHINTIQPKNFRFAIRFNISSRQILDTSSFDLSNIILTDNQTIGDAPITLEDNLNLINVSSQAAFISVNLPDEVQGELRISLTGTIIVDHTEKPVTANVKTIYYDTVKTVRIVLG